MKKLSILLVTGIISCWIQGVSAQSRITITENFDGNTVSFTPTPANAWSKNSVYYASPPYSYRGRSPHAIGDTVVLTTLPYNLEDYTYVQLRFKHICKISPQDITRIEYKRSNEGWNPIPATAYKGEASNYNSTGFNAASYNEWRENDSTAMPTQSWWKEETFELGFEVGGDNGVQFRFVIQHGNVVGTQVSYGWLLDDFEITAAIGEIKPPVVEFLSLVRDTVYGTGPWAITARVETQTAAQIETPWLKYTATENGAIIANDSVLMTNIEGNSIWQGNIPQFSFGTSVQYSITGRDTIGNDKTIASAYVIATGSEETIILQDGSTATSTSPFEPNWGYTRSMALYPATEIATKPRGIIGNIALRVATAGSGAFPMKIWLKTVPATKTTWDASADNLDWSFLTQGATLVYDSNFWFSDTGWVDIPLDNMFSYNGTDNLVVMFEQNCTGTSCATWMSTYTHYYVSTSQTNRIWYKQSNNAPPTIASTLYLYAYRPDLRINTKGITGSNSAATYSIDINDTMIVANNIPIVVTVKNKGLLNLDSVNVSYTVNGSATTSKTLHLNPALAWDLNYQDTIGYYKPKVNGFDTIVVWTSMPNGQLDPASDDDTLTKMIYGKSDIILHLVNSPADTVNNTGPFEITAEIISLSGATIGTVSLYITSLFDGNTTQDTLTMLNTSGNLWTAFTPQKVFGSDVNYAIALTDILGNPVEIKGSYYIKRIASGGGTIAGEVIIGEGTVTNNATPINLDWDYSWSRQLYLGTEISSGASGCTITKLAWYYSPTMPIARAWSFAGQSCYFRAVDDVNITATAYEAPLAARATQVWQGTFTGTGASEWAEITLTTPFELPPGKNLLIYWHHEGGYLMAMGASWTHTTTTQNMTIQAYDGMSFPTTKAGTLSTDRPNARFYIEKKVASGADPDNSVSMVSIDSPEKTVITGVSVPVRVRIRNKGLQNLDSCIINWSLNGQIQLPATVYRGALPEDFTDTITIGSYIPAVVGQVDAIEVWVSMPNGKIDPITNDDILSITSRECNTPLSGIVNIGNGETYTSVNDVLNTIRSCGVGGNVTLALKGTYLESINLTDFADYMNGYSLTITSLDNNPDSAIIQASGIGITLSNMRNLILKNITVDAATRGTNAIQFTGACTNIVVRDCKLLVNATSTYSSSYPVYLYETSATDFVDSLFFINNLLDGGSGGLYFYGGASTSRQQKRTMIFDSNTISNQSNYGFFSYDFDFTSCSYNTILSRTANTNSQWYGLYMYYYNGTVIGNRIIQRSTAIRTPYGIYSSYHYHNADINLNPRGLIANNEIILSSDAHGIYAYNSQSDILHNSIYISGTGTANGMYIYNSTANNVIKNNNIVVTSSTAYPIYIGSTGNLDLDYNNYSAPTYIGYYNGAITSMSAWRAQIATDQHSVSVLPNFISPSDSLTFIHDGGLYCDRLSQVSNDIENTARASMTTMGCYELLLNNVNARLTEITGLRQGLIVSQSDSVKVTVYSAGDIPLTSINLEWSINDTSQNPGGTNYPVSLSFRDSTTIAVGKITYTAGDMNIKVWINHVNSGAIPDEDTRDDTISTSIYVCSSGYSGLLSVGTNPNNDFQTLTQFYEELSVCGAIGDITLALDSGIYAENLDISNNAAWMSNYTLTITSATNNANDVVIRPSSGVGILLNNTQNLIIKAITVDATVSKTNAIEFTDVATNIVVRDCRLLAYLTTSIAGTVNVVYKNSHTGGIVDSIFFINNLLDGGYCSFYFHGGTSQYATNVIFDSNTVSNQYRCGIYFDNTDFTSCSYNTISSRTVNTDPSWTGLYINAANGPVTGNHIIQHSTAISRPYGMEIYFHNASNNPGKGLIANNEIILNMAGDGYSGIYILGSYSQILHNSIYISGTGAARGIELINSMSRNVVIKNNNIVLTSSRAYPVYFYYTGYLNVYDMDYNNYYAPTNIGYYNGDITDLSTWQGLITTDQHSVNVLPKFVNPSISLELSTFNPALSCPSTGILTDIRGISRLTINMGAYMQTADGQDLMLIQLSPWNIDVVNDQTVPINVDLFNMGVLAITNATLGWSVNGVTQQLSVPFTPALNSLEQRNVAIGSFEAINADTFDIVVWVETVNGQQDTVNWNDTVFATTFMYPLAEFVSPVEDTIYFPDFDVSAKIRSITGAPVNPPELYIETIVNNTYTLYDSIPMVLNNDIWQATVPQQYYDSKVIYSLTVSDTFNNTFTAVDSVYIHPVELGKTDTIIIGRGTSAISNTPISMGYSYSWSRQIYLYEEVCPDMSPTGTYITKIAWQSIMANAYYTNQTCYMRAIDDATEVTAYLNPLTNGVSQVWTGSLIILPGWVEITLDMPFFLPAGKNLEIIWHHQHGLSTSSSHTWAHTQMQNTMTVYAVNDPSFPPTAGQLSYYRPNIKIATEAIFEPYTRNNLTIASFLSPLTDFEVLCAADYAPATIVIGNTGQFEYDFSVDTVALYYEIINPQQVKYTGYIPIHRGKLASGKTTTIELMAALPVMYPGRYELKAWIESPADDIIYDNMLVYNYISGKVTLPVDVNFSGSFPTEFISQAVNTSAKWTIVSQGSGSDTVVKPAQGTGMLAFTGNIGAITYLSTRQLELRGTTFPNLEFWYFHDTVESEDYMDVRITKDGGISYTRLLSLLKQDAAYGWKYYIVDLTSYTNDQCIQLVFEAMRMSPGTGSQYIDRIIINSQLDLAVSKIALPLQTACDLQHAELEIILSTVTNQVIDLSNFSSSLAVEISNYQSLAPIPLHKRMEGLTSDTIRIFLPNLSAGNYTVKTYLTSPVDGLPVNDTAYFTVNINPKLSVTVKSLTGNNYCFTKGIPVQQEVILQNTGNLDLTGIELSLLITGDNSTERVKETKTIDLHVGDTISYTFENTYTTLAEAKYQVQVFAWSGCDSVLINATQATEECVDLDNIFLVSIDKPVDGQTDTAGSTENIVVTIKNESDVKPYSNVTVTALIEDENGQMLISRMGILSVIDPLATEQFTFIEPYSIPIDSVYSIRVYLNSLDMYPDDDTVTVKCYSVPKEEVGISSTGTTNAFTLSQNVPNPANNSTRIDYTVPEAGEVVFHVHSISGQLLYSKTIETERGTNSIELNTSTFVAGVYFYSMEYKGQRLVRQLIISN